jgi:hypothetical protein
MTPPTFQQLRAYRLSRGLPWFDDPYDLNLAIVRGELVGEWDDLVCIAYIDEDGREVVESWPCTADAWRGEWADPTHPDGCVYILDQHVPGGYKPGLHRGRLAMRQARPFHYVRWPAALGRVPSVQDLEDRAALHGFHDNRGTHIHNRVSARTPVRPARDDSEGCVVTLRQHHMRSIRDLVALQQRHVGSAVLSPTFVRARDLC